MRSITVSLTDREVERVMQLLYLPCPPGPLKVLDEQIITKLAAAKADKRKRGVLA